MEWLQAVTAFLAALVAIARFFLDWRKSRQSRKNGVDHQLVAVS